MGVGRNIGAQGELGQFGAGASGAAPEFLSGGGEMGELIRAYDWSETPLGPPQTWSTSLVTALRILLDSGYPMYIAWGPEFVQIYNDAYRPILGTTKHPGALGNSTRETFAEIWDFIGPMFRRVLDTGVASTFRDQLLALERNGFAEECYFTFSYSAIRESGRIGGVFVTVIETTERVLRERRQDSLRRLTEALAKPETDILQIAVSTLSGNNLDLPFLAAIDCKATTVIAASYGIPNGSPFPNGNFWHDIDAEDLTIVDLVPGITIQAEPEPELIKQAMLMPVFLPGASGRSALLIGGISPRLALDDDYRAFFNSVAHRVSVALAEAQALHAERRRAEQLAELDRAKTLFFSNISHELRTPLTLMLGPLEDELAKSREIASSNGQHVLEMVYRNGLRLLKLVNELLEFSKIEAGRAQAHCEPTDISAVTIDFASQFRAACQRAGLTLSIDCPPLQDPVFIDRDLWEKVVLNLLSNAFKFTFEGTIAVRIRQIGDCVELEVADSGIGISEAELPRIFDRFHRAETGHGRSFEGTGIGLALVQELVKLHGGTISAESEIGKGTTFRVRIPIGRDHLSPEQENRGRLTTADGTRTRAYIEEALSWLPDAGNQTGIAALKYDESQTSAAAGKRVLVVDDNADMRSYLCRLLTMQSYQVELAADGESALKSVQRRPPDVVLADIMMPRMDGFELLKRLRGHSSTRELPVILLSARAGEESKVEGLDAGADDYLVKPFSARELFARITSVLALHEARRRAEFAAHKESERIRKLFEQAPGFIAVLNGPDHRFEFTNRAYERVVGKRKLVGKSVREALPEIEGQGFLELLDHVYRTGERYVGTEASIKLARTEEKLLEQRFVDFIYEPILDDNGKPTGIFVEGYDVTDRVVAETALRESEERFRLVAENAPVMLWMGDKTGQCVYLNRSQREFWGVTEEALASFDWGSTLHNEDSTVLAPFQQAMERQTAFTVEARYRRSDGAIRILRTDANPRFDSSGEFLGMIGVNVDVTEMRRAEQELRREARVLEIVNRTGAAIAAELQVDEIVQRITDAGVDLTGAEFGAFFYNVLDEKGESYRLYTLSGAPREAFSQFAMPRNTAVFGPTFNGEGVVRSGDITKDPRYGKNVPYEGIPKGHLSVCSYIAVPVRARSGEVIGGLFFGHSSPDIFKREHEALLLGIGGQAATAIDNARLFQAAEREIAERRRVEEALRLLNTTLEQRVMEEVAERSKAEAALLQAQKAEAIGQLTGGIAHDFNNMLAVVIGGLNLMQRRLAAGDTNVSKYIEAATDGANRAASLTQRLLAFARQRPLAPQPLDVNRMVHGMSDLLERTLGEQVKIEVALTAGVWQTNADPVQLENTLLNLAINARDAMPVGGTLTIETANAPVDEDHACALEISQGEYVLISVTDTGTGIPPDVMARAFDPFFTTKGVGKGTGLGLSQVIGFVRQSGGHVKLYSEVGHGTTVKIHLPRFYGDPVPELPRPKSDGSRKGTADEVILVVEDDERVRAYAIEALRELGYTVLHAQSGAAALDRLEGEPKPDLLFTDIAMPDMSGRELAAIVARRWPAMKILFTTGYERNAHNGGVLDHRDANILSKPFNLDQLSAKIRETLNRE